MANYYRLSVIDSISMWYKYFISISWTSSLSMSTTGSNFQTKVMREYNFRDWVSGVDDLFIFARYEHRENLDVTLEILLNIIRFFLTACRKSGRNIRNISVRKLSSRERVGSGINPHVNRKLDRIAFPSYILLLWGIQLIIVFSADSKPTIPLLFYVQMD